MLAPQMHPDEQETSVALVAQLLASQFPQWSNLPIHPVSSAGTDHALYRIGHTMVARLPRIKAAVEQVHKEQRWLPLLAPYLPLLIPKPLAQGKPGAIYFWNWSIYEWLEGENAIPENIADLNQVATQLAQFITALQQIKTTGGPLSGSHNSYRGVPLAQRDEPTCNALAALHGLIDTSAAMAAWEATLQVPVWDKPPVWIHGDLYSGNLLCQQGQLTAVIDFGVLGVGDPACDLIIAWNLLQGEARQVFREALQVDEATWLRGRGWALSIALIQLPYYKDTNPTLAASARHVIGEVLADFKASQ